MLVETGETYIVKLCQEDAPFHVAMYMHTPQLMHQNPDLSVILYG